MRSSKPLLAHWDEILAACIDGKQSQSFERLKSVNDFIDGFLIVTPDDIRPRQLERFFLDRGVDVHPPKV